MKLPSFLLVTVLMFAGPAYAKKMTDRPDERVITGVDITQSTITISTHGVEKTYQTAMNAEFVVNGAKATIRELSPDMKVTSLALSDPATINRIEASGRTSGMENVSSAPAPAPEPQRIVPPPAAAPISSAESQEFANKLSGTYWQAAKGNQTKAWIYLGAEGTASAGWSQRVGTWKVVGRLTIEFIIPSTDLEHPPVDTVVRVDPEFTKMTGYARIYEPRPAMVKRAIGMTRNARQAAEAAGGANGAPPPPQPSP